MRLSINVTSILASILLVGAASGQINPKARALVTRSVNDSRLVTLYGNTRPEAVSQNDRGKVSEEMHFELLLQLKRSPEMQAAADAYSESVSDPKSPNFHKFLKPAEFSSTFGIAAEDLTVIESWLKSHGFTVGSVSPNLALTFSGTAKQIGSAFHTEIHHVNAGGANHVANMSDPQIPEALADAVAGVVKMNDFQPHPHMHAKANYTYLYSDFYLYALVPADLATIYNLNPAFAAGVTGKGQTIMVVEDTDLYTSNDWTTFRNTFGMTRKYPYASLNQVHPQPVAGGPACTDPGVNGDDGEAILDTQWASAAAPNAAIVMASCLNTSSNFGGFIALQNLMANGSTLPNVVSISYGESESSMGATYNTYTESLYQTLATAGVSVFSSSGDSGADTSDQNRTYARYGINISGFTSTRYNVSVGGTDFSDTFFNTNSSYWSQTNGQTYGSALSYVPEIPWNGSCASELFAQAFGYATTYGTNGFCNSSIGTADYFETSAGSGGPSGCVTGTPVRNGIVDGSCAGRPKPSWQTLFGNPSDGVRDVPDVALFASNGYWNHYYVFCYTDPISGRGGAPCAGQPPSNWAGAGGTSFASPIMAGIQALANQYVGGTGYQGLPAPIYYSIANTEYGASGSSSCDSSNGNAVGAGCVFYDVTLGDNNLDCRASTGTDAGLHNCYLPSGTNGVMSVTNGAYAPTYRTNVGWDFPTGIGSVNAWNLIKAYGAAIAPTLPQ